MKSYRPSASYGTLIPPRRRGHAIYAASATVGALLMHGQSALAQTQSDDAIATHHAIVRRHQPAKSSNAPSREDYEGALKAISALTQEVRGLRSEVTAMRGLLAKPQPARTGTTVAVEPSVPTNHAAKIDSVPVATAIVPTAPKQGSSPPEMVVSLSKGLAYGGISITPTGFLEAASIYRSHALGNDIFSNFGAIPFASSRTGHESEARFSARSSRLGLIAEGYVNPSTHLAAVFEMDFLGAAQTANSVEANSFNPRARHLYGTLDLDDSGWHFLAGQTWSLATMNGQGITPRNEIVPTTIDAQLVPGFVWARQPQIRVTKSFSDTFWLAASLENSQTTFTGSVPVNVVDQIANGAGLYGGSANGSPPAAAGGGVPVIPTAATSSLNHLPDLVAKAAYEAEIYGRNVHAEVFGLGRAFTDRIGTSSSTVYGGGGGAGVSVNVIPGRLDVEASVLIGRGIGRYGTALLPDVTFSPSGKIKPITETDWLVGATLHATHSLDIYAYAGSEREERKTYNATYGVGSPLLDLSGCSTERGSCAAATRMVEQGTIGLWEKLYQGAFGHVQFGLQYSYTERRAFSGLNGVAPVANDSMVFTSLRYYPF